MPSTEPFEARITERIACGLVLVAFTVSTWVDFEKVAEVSFKESEGETPMLPVPDTANLLILLKVIIPCYPRFSVRWAQSLDGPAVGQYRHHPLSAGAQLRRM